MGKDFDKSTLNVSERLGQDKAYVIDSTRAREELGWLPKVSLDEGIHGVVGWIEKYWEEIQVQPLKYVHKS